jgi:hypothetical protein
MSDDDKTMLYSLAINCRLWEQDRQPALLNVGSPAETRMVRPAEAWRGYYARTLVEKLDADVARISAVHKWAARKRRITPRPRRGPNAFGRDDWACAVDLCQRGLAIVREAGADRDDFAKRRLLAGLSHALNVETLGPVPGNAQALIDELQAIDDDETRSR